MAKLTHVWIQAIFGVVSMCMALTANTKTRCNRLKGVLAMPGQVRLDCLVLSPNGSVKTFGFQAQYDYILHHGCYVD